MTPICLSEELRLAEPVKQFLHRGHCRMQAMPSRVARLRLAQAVETQFDTSVVAAFEAILAGASEAYRLGKSADFMLEMREHELGAEVQPALALAQ